jgi:hypothetical protein
MSDLPLRQGPMIPADMGQNQSSDSQKLTEIVSLLREIRDLLKPKAPGRPKKQS